MEERSILFVVSGSEGYGVRYVWSLLVRSLSGMGFKIVIAVLDGQFADSWRTKFPNVDVVHPPLCARVLSTGRGRGGGFWKIFCHGTSQFKFAYWLRGVVRSRLPEVIIYQGPIESLLCGIVARISGIPALWFVPNIVGSGRFLDLNKRIYRSLFRFCNVIPVANSHYTDSTFGGSDFRRHVVHLGVDTDFFQPVADGAAFRKSLGLGQDVTVIGLFARMTASKGQLRLVEAMAELSDDIHLLFCGGPLEGKYYQDLVETIASLGIVERVHFVGYQTDLRLYYAASNIIVNLLEGPEGFGLTVVEAMACGKPVLAHAAGGPSETILDGTTGWLIPDCGVAEIVEGFRRVTADRQRWAEMGRLGRERADVEFSLHRFESRVKEVFNEVL